MWTNLPPADWALPVLRGVGQHGRGDDGAGTGQGEHETRRGLSGRSQPRRIADMEGNAEERLPLSISEFSRVLGGGIVPGSIVLIGGDPGIGKSTLMLQVTMEMANTGARAVRLR